MEPEEIELLKFLLSNNKTRYGRGATGTSNGLPQGSTISPMLFNVYIEELAERLTKAGIAGLFYADDIVIIGNDDDVKRAIAIVEEWCSKSNMAVSKSKCGILGLRGSQLGAEVEYQGYPVVR